MHVKKTARIIACSQCRKKFSSSQPLARFCSAHCCSQWQHYNLLIGPFICKNPDCQKQFLAKRRGNGEGTSYCSRECYFSYATKQKELNRPKCSKCGMALLPKRKILLCRPCMKTARLAIIEDRRRIAALARSQKPCRACGKSLPLGQKKYCKPCAKEINRANTEARKIAGVCAICRKSGLRSDKWPVGSDLVCDDCWMLAAFSFAAIFGVPVPNKRSGINLLKRLGNATKLKEEYKWLRKATALQKEVHRKLKNQQCSARTAEPTQ